MHSASQNRSFFFSVKNLHKLLCVSRSPVSINHAHVLSLPEQKFDLAEINVMQQADSSHLLCAVTLHVDAWIYSDKESDSLAIVVFLCLYVISLCLQIKKLSLTFWEVIVELCIVTPSPSNWCFL